MAIGAVSGVEPALFETAFSLCRDGVLEAAELHIRRVEAEWACPACASPIPAGTALRCGSCGVDAKLARGDELARLHGSLPVARGEHILEVLRPGYQPKTVTVLVEGDEPTRVRVDLEPEE